MKDLIAPELDQYIRGLLPARHPVIAEMEEQARQRDIPITIPLSLMDVNDHAIAIDVAYPQPG